MASHLFRLGRFAARRAWAVVLTWLLVFALVGAGAATLGKPFTSKLTIPGTEFQQILDDLQTSVPKAAAGIGTVVFSTADGRPFTAAQREAIGAVMTDWGRIDGVDTVVDPFATQGRLDEAVTKVGTGKTRLAQAGTTIAANETRLAEGKRQLAAGRTELEAKAAELAAGQRRLVAGQAELDAGKRQLATRSADLAQGRRELAAAAAKTGAGRQQLNAAKAQLAEGLEALTTGRSQLAAGRQQLAAARAEIAEGRRQLAVTITETDQLADRSGESDPQVQAARAEIAQQTAALDAAQHQADATATRLAATEKTLQAKAAQLTAGQRKVSAQESTLVAGERKVAAGRARLAAGERRLAAARTQLAAGEAELRANRTKLAQGAAAIAEGRARLTASQTELARGEQQLAAAKTQLIESRAELTRGERQLGLTQGLRTVDAAGTVALGQVLFTLPLQSVPVETKDAVIAEAAGLRDAGVRVDFSKELAEDIAGFMGPGEAIGLAIAGLVLIVMLGSLLAAGLPLLTAVIGVAVGLGATVALTHWVTMSDVTPALALMLGLAVGIDYALFLVNRHREQLARGVDLEESIGRATATAGSAVVFAGLTVITALAALTLTGIPFLGVMGLVAAGTVAVAVLISITLTPALLHLMGRRVLSPKARTRLAEHLAAEAAEADAEDTQHAADAQHAADEGPAGRHAASRPTDQAGQGHGWGGFVTRHPIWTLGVATVLLALMAIPAAGLKLGLPDGSYEPADSTGYRTYAAVEEHFGAGANGPIIAVAESTRATSLDAGALTDLELTIGSELRAVPGVAYVVPIGTSADQRTLAFQLVPTTGPSEDATADLVHRLRDRAPAIASATGIDSLGYTGQTVANIDISKALRDALPLYLAVVVGISLVLLLLVFRSIVVPLLATAGFLLSVAAAFGAVVAVYQWGWLGSLFGVERPGLILSFLPTLVIGILFGLAMDYQMFMVSGMREAWAHGHTARTAVRTGFSHGARVVTAAALIMTAVFGSFVYAHLTMIRPIGFALAIGVLIDAFVVRMTAMPAVMHLIGERAWYLPSWLRWLPDLDVEGTRLAPASTGDHTGRHTAEHTGRHPAEHDTTQESDVSAAARVR